MVVGSIFQLSGSKANLWIIIKLMRLTDDPKLVPFEIYDDRGERVMSIMFFDVQL